MCEVLITAEDWHWIDDLNQGQRNQLRPAEIIKYEARPRMGDPVACVNDSHIYGPQEKLPKFVKIKLPGIPKENIRPYLVMLMADPDEEGNAYVLRCCRFQFAPGLVQNMIDQEIEFITVVAQDGFTGQLNDKLGVT